MKTVLIIGAAGFVGSHLTKCCLSNHWKVIGVDDFSSGKQSNLNDINNKNFTLMKQDLSKPDGASLLKRKISKTGVKKIDDIIHLAARKIPRYGKRLETLVVNIETTRSAGELAGHYKSRLIFASTSDVYGLSTDLPFKESGNLAFGPSHVARWAYGASKYIGEQLAFGFSEEYRIPIVIVRIFGVYGPRQVKGWKGNAVSAFFEQAINKNIYEMHGNGKQTRSFLYISDLNDLLLLILKSERGNNQIINAGTSESVSMIDLSKKIHQLVNKKIKFSYKLIDYLSFTGKEYQDVMVKNPDLRQVVDIYGWRSKVDLDSGLAKTWGWYEKL